jgi:hypothetical protein
MSEKLQACLRGWKTIAAGLALLGAAALPAHAADLQAEQPAEQAATAPADAITVVRDAETGKLRAPTAQELETLQQAGQAKKSRVAPAAPLQKFHPNGAIGVRLTDEFMSTAVVVRNAKGGLDMQCLEPGHSAQAAHSASSHATQPVEE